MKNDIWKDIERLSELKSNYSCFDEKEEPYYHALSNAIQALREQEAGEWLFDAEHSITIDMFKCSVCGSGGHVHFNYCPNCGARMEAENESN